ncbi:Cu2+-exporting ATPase [Palleronia marisminoris]|uniref:Putative copper-importing P-type ATPase A n=1 Tax=Palleronia marisminoris TaxID=315423 RepID=A0A1Y5RL58_9RHOB|nr:heavy metal translocating P-type ATPase [Palleronia marisminoris]SFG24786.1 Cu2+-exporting ATPase [Palleronia marisminoris]SLN19088.1 putative copper-importing P-type ATPase A [Palleronia marisminoris]
MTAACPACATAPFPERSTPAEPSHVLHLPDIHCALCIASVESTLNALPHVQASRVNLTRKRVFVTAPGATVASLIEALAKAGHRAERLDTGRLGPEDTTRRELLTRIGVAGFAMMNVMLLSVAVWSGATGVTGQVFHLVSAAIAIPAVTYSAQPFFASAWSALSARRLNMDVPISLAIILACAASMASAFGFSDRAGWFDAALALTFFLLVGRYLEHAGRAAARSAAADLAALEAPQAVRLDGEHETIVAAESLAPGDLIRIRPGDRMPADGTIIDGRSDMDRSALTGESLPEAAGIGDTVTSGETCLTGLLTVRVDRAGRDTALARMAELVATAESQRTRYAGIADRAARIYAPLVHVLGAATFLGWLGLTGDFWRSLDVGISVLVITCPCALGLAVPAVSTVATARLFRGGILVKSDTALERLSEIDTVAFDKTGTLTTGTPALAELPDDRALAIAAGLAQASKHPLSRAILAAAEARGIAPATIDDTAERPGYGVEGLLDNRRVRLGREGWAGESSGDASAWLSIEGEPPVPFRTRETLRPEAQGAIDTLHRTGYATALLSGDGAQAVSEIAARTGIDAAEARLSPTDKVDWLDRRAGEGRHVLMVGDGLNDTGGLASAHAGMSPGSALDAARSAADVILLSGGLDGVPRTLATARTAMARMRQNIALAALYNVVSVPLAMAGFATPFAAAIAMSLSSITVTLNAVRRFR